MKTPTYCLRNTQTLSLEEFLRELHCTLLLAAGKDRHLTLLGADRNGLIRQHTSMTGIEAVAGQGRQVAVWGRRRLELLSRGRLLSGKKRGALGRLLLFKTKKAARKPGNLVALQWGRAGLWGVDNTGFGLLDKAGNYTKKQEKVFHKNSRAVLSGLAMADGEPAYLTTCGLNGGNGRILHAQSRAVVLPELDGPSAPLLIDSSLYFLEGSAGRVISCDLQRGTYTLAVQLPGPANGMIRFGDHLLISLGGRRPGLCSLHLGSGCLTALHGLPADTPMRLLDIIAGRPYRSHHLAAALKAACVLAAAGLVFAQAPVSARAADIIFTEQVPNIPLYGAEIGYWINPTFVDIDNDGDFDAFFGESGGTVNYFENTGINTASAFVERTGTANPLNGVDVGKYSTPTFVDIDNDGDFDAFIGEMLGTVKYYENTGNHTVPIFVERTGAANPLNGVDVGYSSAPTFVDIDGDGDFDAFIGENTGIVHYYENTGTNASPAFVERTDAANPLNGVYVGNTPTFVDIDNDGDFDAFIGESGGTVNYFENTGTNTSPIFVERTGAANLLNGVDVRWDSAPTFVDIDGDGDFDAFIGGVSNLGPALRNNGTVSVPSFARWNDPTVPLATVNVEEYSTPTFVDIDGDGDFDAFIGEYPDGVIKYYENTGTNTEPIFVERTGAANPLSGASVDYIATPTFVDIDGDGDFDAFIGEYYGAVEYYENTGTNTEAVFVERTGAANPLNGVEVGWNNATTFVDIDNDGDFDAFIGEDDGNVNYFENTGTNTTPIFVEQTGTANPLNGVDVGYVSTPAFVDIDSDGDFDVFIGERDGVVNYFKNTGTNSAPAFAEQTGNANPLNGVNVGSYSTPAFVDIDGDGDFDVFIGEETGVVNSFRNDPRPPNITPVIMLLLSN